MWKCYAAGNHQLAINFKKQQSSFTSPKLKWTVFFKIFMRWNECFSIAKKSSQTTAFMRYRSNEDKFDWVIIRRRMTGSNNMFAGDEGGRPSQDHRMYIWNYLMRNFKSKLNLFWQKCRSVKQFNIEIFSTTHCLRTDVQVTQTEVNWQWIEPYLSPYLCAPPPPRWDSEHWKWSVVGSSGRGRPERASRQTDFMRLW